MEEDEEMQRAAGKEEEISGKEEEMQRAVGKEEEMLGVAGKEEMSKTAGLEEEKMPTGSQVTNLKSCLLCVV
jgi:hypothetical protein